MNRQIYKSQISKFMDDLASKKPTPGGGVVAGLSAQFAASLIEMVCNLTVGKKGYEKVEKTAIKLRKDASEIKAKLSNLTEEDARAFDAVIKAYKSKDKSKIRKALKHAIEVPMEVRKLAQELEKIGYRVSKIGNKNAVSDARTAIHLAHAASKSALENVSINKRSLVALK